MEEYGAITIPTEGMYRMWYAKTGVLKKKPSSDIQTYLHTRGSKNYLQRKQSGAEGEILKPDWLSRASLFPLLIPSAGSYRIQTRSGRWCVFNTLRIL